MASKKVKRPITSNFLFFYGYIIVATAFLVFLVIFGMQFTFGIFLKPILSEFGWTRAMMSGAFSLAMIVSGLVSIALGRLNDRFGPRIVLSICGVFAGFGFLLMSLISSVWQLYLFYGVITAIGISVYVPLMSTVARWFVKRRTTMSGIVTTGTGMGIMIGGPVANRLISAFDWRSSYAILGSVGLVTVVGLAQFLRRDPKQMGQVVYGENEMVKERPELIGEVFSLKEAVSTKQFWTILVMFLCVGLCFHSIMAHLVSHVTDLGISATSAANVMAALGGASIVGKLVLGGLGDKIGNRNVLTVAWTIMIMALLLMFVSRAVSRFYLFAALFGLAYGGLIAQQSAMVGAIFGLVSHGMIFGAISVGLYIGQAMGPVITGYIFDVTGSYQLAFLVDTIASALGLILTVLLNPKITKSKHRAII
jgi:MFS family permease